MSEERHTSGTVVYIRDGQILRGDMAREAKAIKDAEDVVRQVLDDPKYQLRSERSGEDNSESGDEEEGLIENEQRMIIKKEVSEENRASDICQDIEEKERDDTIITEYTAGRSRSQQSMHEKEDNCQKTKKKLSLQMKKNHKYLPIMNHHQRV